MRPWPARIVSWPEQRPVARAGGRASPPCGRSTTGHRLVSEHPSGLVKANAYGVETAAMVRLASSEATPSLPPYRPWAWALFVTEPASRSAWVMV